jgi:formylglycine-generating enzyme required for sulfatase activity
VRAGHAAPDDWQTQLGKLDHPMARVTWHDPMAYVAWLSEHAGERWRLPTEAEWEKAARGTDGRIYPWGDTFDKTRCNTIGSDIWDTTPVGSYPTGASPYGVQDMAGNVCEWTEGLKVSYPYIISGEHEVLSSPDRGVLRGGCMVSEPFEARAARRHHGQLEGFEGLYNGFRLVRADPNS